MMNENRMKNWMKKIGLWGVLFFTVKGLLWLLVIWLISLGWV